MKVHMLGVLVLMLLLGSSEALRKAPAPGFLDSVSPGGDMGLRGRITHQLCAVGRQFNLLKPVFLSVKWQRVGGRVGNYCFPPGVAVRIK